MTVLIFLTKFIRRYILSIEAIAICFILFVMYHSLFRWKVLKFLNHDSNKASPRSELNTWSYQKENVAVYAIQGRRPYMEDEFDIVNDYTFTNISLYGIFDGHGGKVSSSFVKKLLLKSVLVEAMKAHKSHTFSDLGTILTQQILDIDQKLVSLNQEISDISGTTCLVAAVRGDTLVMANVGDSRGVMCDQNGSAYPLTVDHKPDLAPEKERIERAGGYVAFFGVWRVMGVLAMSRTLGDHVLKAYITAEPDVFTFNLTTSGVRFLVLATDGLWDVFTNQEVVDFLTQRLDEPFHGAKSLVLEAYERNSIDNITVMVIMINR